MLAQSIHLQTIALLALVGLSSASWKIIAHRGVFHDRLDVYCTAENSIDAVTRATNFKNVNGVEIDVQVSSDGQLLAFHDRNLNALTIKDNADGVLNALDVGLGAQKSSEAVPISKYTARSLIGTPLKIYAKGGRIVRTQSKPKLESLETTLNALKSARSGFMIILDINTPYTFEQAGALVRKLGMEKKVYLKFWAGPSLDTVGKYTGADSCYQYARSHGLSDLMIIPEINEMSLIKGTTKVNAWGGLTVAAYLNCWRDAQRDHTGNGAAIMPMVSAMLPNDGNSISVRAANQAFNWAQENGRPKVSIIVMPDLCSGRGWFRKGWRIENGVGAFVQNRVQVDMRTEFCNRRADYCVVDVLGDLENFYANNEYEEYMAGICYTRSDDNLGGV